MPRIVCALKPDSVIFHLADQDIDVYDVCKEDRFKVVMYYIGTSDIFICSNFFLMSAQPSAGNCATVNEATNRFEGDFDAFWLAVTDV